MVWFGEALDIAVLNEAGNLNNKKFCKQLLPSNASGCIKV